MDAEIARKVKELIDWALSQNITPAQVAKLVRDLTGEDGVFLEGAAACFKELVSAKLMNRDVAQSALETLQEITRDLGIVAEAGNNGPASAAARRHLRSHLRIALTK